MNRKNDALLDYIIQQLGITLLASVGIVVGILIIVAFWLFIPSGLLLILLKVVLSIIFLAAMVFIALMMYRIYFLNRDEYREKVQEIQGSEE